jgi:hypothetical protein
MSPVDGIASPFEGRLETTSLGTSTREGRKKPAAGYTVSKQYQANKLIMFERGIYGRRIIQVLQLFSCSSSDLDVNE